MGILLVIHQVSETYCFAYIAKSKGQKSNFFYCRLKQGILYVDGWRASFKILYFFRKTLMILF